VAGHQTDRTSPFQRSKSFSKIQPEQAIEDPESEDDLTESAGAWDDDEAFIPDNFEPELMPKIHIDQASGNDNPLLKLDQEEQHRRATRMFGPGDFSEGTNLLHIVDPKVDRRLSKLRMSMQSQSRSSVVKH